MVDLVGIQIKDLSTAGAISGTTELPVQRTGINKAEKISLVNLTNYVLASTEFTTSLNTNVNSRVNAHIAASDPHGDRAYTNSLMTTHTSSSDPHGDRAFATSSINTAISNHNSASDPHGDRAYTNTQITTHTSAVDPHGDRAFATNVGSTTLSSANTYTDNKVNTEFTNRVGSSIAPLTGGKVPDTYINQELSFSSYSSFPATGVATKLYVDTSGNDVYRWNGTSYTNLTPAVDVGSLSLTTNDVAPGSNTDRQYLTAAKNTEFTNKVSDVLGETTANTQSVFSRKTSNIAYVKNINSTGNISLVSNPTTITIQDNHFTYTGSGTGNVTLATDDLRGNVLAVYSADDIFRIKGEVFVYTTTVTAGSTIVTENNVFNIDARTSLLGVTQPVPVVYTASIDNTGVSLTGTALPNSTLEIYDNTYTLITTRPINALGDFSYTFSPARVEGDPIYLYVKTPSNERSSRYTIYEPNTTGLREISGVSVSADGLTVRGVAERLSTIELFNSVPTSLGTATANSNGFFEITLSAPLTDTEAFTITSVNSLSTTSPVYNGVANLKVTVATYEVSINNERTTISGKGEADGSVSIYTNTDTLLVTLPINSNGSFSGNLPVAAANLSDFKLIVEKDSSLSQTVNLTIPDKLTMQTQPVVIPILVDSVYDFIYKDINKRLNNTNFGFDININTTTFAIELKGTNNLNKLAKWKANLEITVESI